jgi:hypothetical protein
MNANDLRASNGVQPLGLDVSGDVVRVTKAAVEVGLFEVGEVHLATELGEIEHLQTVVGLVSDDVSRISDDLGIAPRGWASAMTSQAYISNTFF